MAYPDIIEGPCQLCQKMDWILTLSRPDLSGHYERTKRTDTMFPDHVMKRCRSCGFVLLISPCFQGHKDDDPSVGLVPRRLALPVLIPTNGQS